MSYFNIVPHVAGSSWIQVNPAGLKTPLDCNPYLLARPLYNYNLSTTPIKNFLPTLIKIFTFAQWFGIPSYGRKLSVLWAVLVLVMLVAIESCSLWKLIRALAGTAKNVDGRGLTARLSGTIFYGNGLLSLLLSWRFISSWKRIAFFWKRAESADKLNAPTDKKIQFRVLLVSCFVGICAIEHGLSMLSAIGLDSPLSECFRQYVLNSHGFLIGPDDYSLWTAIPIFLLSKIATILWNFQDLIIILISMGLTSRYHRLNSYVNYVVKYERITRDTRKFGTDKYARNQIWRHIREAYVRQAALVRMTDANIGALILLSNVNNFYFICLQLFLGLTKTQGSIMGSFYYLISLGWLVFRACSVVLAAADVHIHSRQALAYLQTCPRIGYNVEIKRLYNQLTNDYVALSGKKFFLLSRQTLLEVAANIIKYELVLIQYDK